MINTPLPLSRGEEGLICVNRILWMLMPFPLWKRELWHFQSFFFTLHHETYQKLDSHQGTANSAAAVEEKGPQGGGFTQSSGTVSGTAELYE